MVAVVVEVVELVGADGSVRSFASLDEAERTSGQLRRRQVTRKVPGVFRVVAGDDVFGEFDRVAEANTTMRQHPGSRIEVVAKATVT